MFQKLLTLALGVTVVGHMFFRPQLKQLGQRIDRLVTLMVVAIVITWTGQLAYFLVTHR
jgi:heme/copper-type cytochrome/quinol oxidase subunit 2